MINSYIQSRVDDQINWMGKKSKSNQQMYKLLKILEIFAAAAIPFLAGYSRVDRSLPIITGALGVLIVILNGIQQLYRYKENWLSYRITIEALKKEKMLFENKAGIYRDEDAFPKFVENIEALLANENKIWQTNMVQKAEQKK